MNKLFYPKLAYTNLKNNKKSYIPYILTSAITIMMFYNIYALANHPALENMRGGENLKILLALGIWIIGIFSLIFLTYTNQFLIKRRKKEFGLFNILGMEKRHLTRVMFFELLFIGGISLISGILTGIIFNKLTYLGLAKILHFDVKFGFYISIQGLKLTALIFLVIFLVTFINNLRQIHLAHPIELLKGDKTGEKEPKIRWILLLVGIISLALGYIIAIVTKDAVDAMRLFFIAVVLVIIGTYCLFTTGSIALLKLLRKNKTYYYKTENFISVSTMMYRMKQNAIGLGNICILSTMVLVMVSTTISLYVGVDDNLEGKYPKDINLYASVESLGDNDKTLELLEEIELATKATFTNLSWYNYIETFSSIEKNEFNFYDFSDVVDEEISGQTYYRFLLLEDYNQVVSQPMDLTSKELILLENIGYEGNEGKNLDILGSIYDIKHIGKVKELEKIPFLYEYLGNIIVVKDQITLNNINQRYSKKYAEFYEGSEGKLRIKSSITFDIEEGIEKELEVVDALFVARDTEGTGIISLSSHAYDTEIFFSIYGGLFFLGIFLGILFMMATILIMYYKQISEGHDDRERFKIMQQVGMNKEEIKKIIGSQVLIVFFLPLVTAVIHICFAFPIISKMLAILDLTNTSLFIVFTIITVAIFTLVYGLVYLATAKEYYKIVSGKELK